MTIINLLYGIAAIMGFLAAGLFALSIISNLNAWAGYINAKAKLLERAR